MSRRILTALIALSVAGCMPFPRWAYLSETRVEPANASSGFSASELQVARDAAAEVAGKVGMKPADEKPEDLATAELWSETRSPPRTFVRLFEGKLMHGLSMNLRVELSDNGRFLYFTLTDPNRGTPSPTFQRIDGLLEARVRSAFPGLGVTHEAKPLGPIWSLPP